MSQKHIAVLIPCFNEAQTVGKVVADFRRVLPEAAVYVYDNNSTDGTAELARQAGAVVRRETRQGKGNVIRTMFREIDADCYLLVDGDDTYPAESAEALCDLVLQDEAAMAIGDRLSATYFEENKRPLHGFGNRLVRACVGSLWGDAADKVLDVMTGYRAFSALFVKSFPVLSQGFEIETEMTVHALNHNLRIKSMPVPYRDRPQGSVSKLNTYADGFRVLAMILHLYRSYRPLRFFGGIGVLLAVLSLALFLPVLGTYLDTGLVPRFPTLIVSSVMMLAAMLSLVCGLILDASMLRSRREFELHMNTVAMMLAQKRKSVEIEN
ncbi:MAG: glycosyltransferase [Schwartzia sp.]|nr:glycosyltransferase [Schwartzia sp. (in: firmicutes)]